MEAAPNTYRSNLKILVDQIKATRARIPTNVSDLTNDSNFQTEAQVDEKINAKVSCAYRAGGSVAFADLPELTEANLGLVVNVTGKFTTTADFVEGEGSEHPAGTNVVIVQAGEAYKYDALAGFVDLSGYAKTSDFHAVTDAELLAMFEETSAE